jgi:hypothetical protein
MIYNARKKLKFTIMPNQPNNSVQQDNNSIYSNMDEMLAKPPSNIVRYGSITILFLLLILCGIGFFVNYDDGITGIAYIQADSTAEIKSPLQNVIVEKNFIQSDTILKKGDTILMLKTPGNTIQDNPSSIPLPFNSWALVAPFAGKIICQRKLTQGDLIESNSLLFVMAGGQNRFKVKIAFAETFKEKIALGQIVKIAIPGYQQNNLGKHTCEIISLPYTDSVTQKMVVDATLIFNTESVVKKSMAYFFKTSAEAYIISNRKSLAAAFLGL